MAMTTYFNGNEYKTMSFINDEINEVFQEVREIHPNIYVKRYFFTDTTWYGKKTTRIRFSVYNKLDDGMEAQCLRVPSELLTYRELYAYFFGLINSKIKATIPNTNV
tara:strand:+ start:2016 stop:2336 length:321 start_codon:yes stop_codon:yes gene_type:complete